MLPVTMPILLAQECPGSFTVVLVDDRSSDGTAAVAAALADRLAGRFRWSPGKPARRLLKRRLG